MYKRQVETSAGFTERFGVAGQSVARFHEQLTDLLRRAGATTDISGGPNELEEAIPFREDTADREWDAATLTRIHRAFSDASCIFERFRSGFVGKSSPSHLFWGSLDPKMSRRSVAAPPDAPPPRRRAMRPEPLRS